MNNSKSPSQIKLSSSPRSSLARRFLRDERGLSSIEYVILMVMVVVGAVGVWKQIGSEFKTGLGSAHEDMVQINEE